MRILYFQYFFFHFLSITPKSNTNKRINFVLISILNSILSYKFLKKKKIEIGIRIIIKLRKWILVRDDKVSLR